MKLEEMKQRKRELGYSNERIAELSGVPLSTVQKIFAGVTQQPRYETLMALGRVLGGLPDRVGEAVFQYSAAQQGTYTIADYELLPEDRRAELIDGVLYDMSGPFLIHQSLATVLCRLLTEHIRRKQGKCIVMTAPADVHLCRDDDRTIVQPDVFVVCDRSKFTRRRIEGAPDLVMEVISPSTKNKDFTIKLQKYLEAGVREYWLVDPDTRKIVVYVLEEDIIPQIYTFDDRIPVAIFNGDCIIDMTAVTHEIQFFYELEDSEE